MLLNYTLIKRNSIGGLENERASLEPMRGAAGPPPRPACNHTRSSAERDGDPPPTHAQHPPTHRPTSQPQQEGEGWGDQDHAARPQAQLRFALVVEELEEQGHHLACVRVFVAERDVWVCGWGAWGPHAPPCSTPTQQGRPRDSPHPQSRLLLPAPARGPHTRKPWGSSHLHVCTGCIHRRTPARAPGR